MSVAAYQYSKALSCGDAFFSENNDLRVIKSIMEIGYKEMAEINLQLTEICFAAESEVEGFYRAIAAESE